MMDINVLRPRQALNKAYLKLKPTRTEIEIFKAELIKLIDQSNDTESEEFHKNLVSDFLKKTYYKEDHFINTKDTKDLVIHEGKVASSPVNVIIEAKKPTNKSEMITTDNINAKAFQETILYFLRERILDDNKNIKYLIITNIYEWFIFDATLFEKLFVQNKKFVKEFKDFSEGRLSGTKTEFFYNEIAKTYINQIESKIEFVHFDIRSYDKPLRDSDKRDDTKLIALFKTLSPQHLLKLPFHNDSNTLDKSFYSEFLHLLGLEETKKGSKKLIERNKPSQRNTGSIIENTIIQLDSQDEISNIENIKQYGETEDDQLFSIALELTITWINRILFLKLLESQLVSYHKGNSNYSFLNYKKLKSYDDLNTLFFQVLAKESSDRNSDVKIPFENIPYLNSSLFEPTDIERATFTISSLRDDKQLPIFKSTVLKDDNGKKDSGEKNAIEYLFKFLDAYDFSSESTEDIQEDSKSLINAAVLGLIYEKINGYKDGAFFTPGHITMYMCRESIRASVIQRFNDTNEWECRNIDDVYNKISDLESANNIVNSIRICDPAVGSGHFLVSALNELIALKYELGILCDPNGKRLRDYDFEIVNDELIITNDDGKFFEYRPDNKESQRIQEALFHEKETLIENCLFGVDINPNSVKICRLRLWIELLKSSYYKGENQLETLPNIDINIKVGNSLISRYELNSDLKSALKKLKIKMSDYRDAVNSYKTASTKIEKREMENLINSIKSGFRTEIQNNDPLIIRRKNLESEIIGLVNQEELFLDKTKEREKKGKIAKKKNDLNKIEIKINAIETNKMYEKAFEWKIEFPEVLDSKGNFLGFDVIVGNPPYGLKEKGKDYLNFVAEKYPLARKVPDSYFLFMLRGLDILKDNGHISHIVPNTFCDLEQGDEFRRHLLEKNDLYQLYDSSWVFDDAVVDTVVYFQKKSGRENPVMDVRMNDDSTKKIPIQSFINNNGLKIDYRANQLHKDILNRIESSSRPLSALCTIKAGVKLYEKGKGAPPQTPEIVKDKPYTMKGEKLKSWRPLVRGGDINRFLLKGINEFVEYGNHLAAPREEGLFTGERIFMRRTDDVIRSVYITDDSVCVNSCHVIISDDRSLSKYLLGLLNSRLMQWIFELKNPQMVNKDFAEIKVTYVSSLPVVIATNTEAIESIVESIMEKKSLSVDANTSKLEQELDKLIYKAYSLTAEEIGMIDACFD